MWKHGMHALYSISILMLTSPQRSRQFLEWGAMKQADRLWRRKKASAQEQPRVDQCSSSLSAEHYECRSHSTFSPLTPQVMTGISVLLSSSCRFCCTRCWTRGHPFRNTDGVFQVAEKMNPFSCDHEPTTERNVCGMFVLFWRGFSCVYVELFILRTFVDVLMRNRLHR
ncbi:hypothetical protein EDD18DRAFT_428564 [Armillaria luteobubalina]|uniref:Uncharacterized protein n=1 Tax=Armillaria luteobubalina TaxID=153913 RepID=A0AA39ULJ9_9AGAR|nr:hypothetical protein EDD18DRAFT_428564 [Armillaria luteobubalina]